MFSDLRMYSGGYAGSALCRQYNLICDRITNRYTSVNLKTVGLSPTCLSTPGQKDGWESKHFIVGKL